MIDFSQNHFALFGLAPTYRLDAQQLDAAYRRLQAIDGSRCRLRRG